MVSDGLQIVGIVIEVVAVGYLRRTAVAAPVVRDDPITLGEEEQHLRVPIVRRERPAMTKHDRLAAAPIFIVDLYSLFGCDVAHIFSFLLMVHCCQPRFNSDKNQVRRPHRQPQFTSQGKDIACSVDEKDHVYVRQFLVQRRGCRQCIQRTNL